MALTRRERLICMKGCDLIRIADKLGVKVSCNRARTALKESKEAVVDRVIAAEEKLAAKTQKPAEPEVKAEDKPEIKQTIPPAEPAEPEAWEDNNYEDRQARAEESDQAAENAVNQKKPTSRVNREKSADRKSKKIKELTYDGKTQSIKAWAEELQIPYPTLYDRINRNGWSVEEAIEIPLGQRRSR